VKLFIQSGADVNTKHKNGFSALLLLCQNNVNDNLIILVQLLIEKGADVNVMEETRNKSFFDLSFMILKEIL